VDVARRPTLAARPLAKLASQPFGTPASVVGAGVRMSVQLECARFGEDGLLRNRHLHLRRRHDHLELGRRVVAEPRMRALAVVEDLDEHRRARLCFRGPRLAAMSSHLSVFVNTSRSALSKQSPFEPIETSMGGRLVGDREARRRPRGGRHRPPAPRTRGIRRDTHPAQRPSRASLTSIRQPASYGSLATKSASRAVRSSRSSMPFVMPRCSMQTTGWFWATASR
jgi:hypothetical protein